MIKPLHLRTAQALDVESNGDQYTKVSFRAFENLPSPKKEASGPGGGFVKPWHCQAALATAQTLFVIGSVYLKRCLQLVDASKDQTFHPIIYAFLREAIAGPILWALAIATTGRVLPKGDDYLRVALLGGCLFFNQLFFILGIALSGVVVATCIQPTIPVFTALLALMMGTEQGSVQKFAGIALAVGGSISMVLGGISSAAHHSAAETQNMLLGNACLLGNTLSMSLYYLNAKALVAKYAPLAVTAWAYMVAATLMGSTAALTIERHQWGVPRQLFGPLVYWILVCSVVGYWVVTAATAYLPASQVAAFQCLQPFVGTALAVMVLGEEPTWWDLGAIGVIAGLALVATDKADMQYLQPMLKKMRRILSQTSLYAKPVQL